MSLVRYRALVQAAAGACFALCVLALAACSVTSLDSVRRCRVFEDVGGKSTPAGLITLPQELEESLLAQLPRNGRQFSTCWYVYGENLVVANYAREGETVGGYLFVKEGKSWKLDGEDGILLAVPSYVE